MTLRRPGSKRKRPPNVAWLDYARFTFIEDERQRNDPFERMKRTVQAIVNTQRCTRSFHDVLFPNLPYRP